MIRNAYSALESGGRIMIEDWMFTENSTEDDRDAMNDHHHAGAIAGVMDLQRLLVDEGFAVQREEDLGEVGRTHMATHFVPQFNQHVRPRLEADFPGHPISGKQMADEWVAGIEATIQLYQSRKMTYFRLVATKT
jgi:hypothetical protein